MMITSSNYRIVLSSAIVLALGILFGIVWYLASVIPFTTYQIYTEDPVSGLVIDAPVEYHGVDVGTVKKIELVNPHLVKILLSINKTAPVTKGTIATIISNGLTSKGFTGYVYISLEDITQNPKPLIARPGDEYPTIPTLPSKFNTLDAAMGQLNNNAQQIVDILESLLDKKTIAALKELINSMELVTKTLANNNQKITSLMNNAEKASYQFKPFLDSSNHTLHMLETQLLPKAYDSLSNLDNLTDSLSIFVAKLKQDPSILIRGTAKEPPGPGETK